MHAYVAGQYDGFAAQGLDSGLERSKNGRNLGFLANMEWRPKHVVLASCHAVAGLQILSRQEDEYHLGSTCQALQGVTDMEGYLKAPQALWCNTYGRRTCVSCQPGKE